MNKILLTAFLLLMGSYGYAQTGTPDYKKSLEFLQGNGVYENGINQLIALEILCAQSGMARH